METEYWVLSIIAIALALVAGFIGGRMSAPRQRRVEAMEQERDAAREEAEAVRAEVNRHFEESARMFGKLASDYRTFFQQFAQTAQNLGLSEGRARELLEEADPNLAVRQAKAADNAGAPADAANAGSGSPDSGAPATGESGADPAAESTATPDGIGKSPSSADTAEAPDPDGRPGAGESTGVPPDYEAERDRRG